MIALLVSGGHTELVYVLRLVTTRLLGKREMTQLGEAYDKVGRVMGLTYPAGREIDELAHQGRIFMTFLVP